MTTARSIEALEAEASEFRGMAERATDPVFRSMWEQRVKQAEDALRRLREEATAKA